MSYSTEKFAYSQLVKVMEGETSNSTFEVVFRGSDENEAIQLNDVATTNSTDTSDLSTRVVPEQSRWMMDNKESVPRPLKPEEDSPLRETHSDPFRKPRWWREASKLSIIITGMIIFCVCITLAMVIQIIVGAPQVTPHSGVLSDDAQCSEIGLALLKASSEANYETASSVDAAILTSLCLMIKNPHKGGLGGGGFMLIEKQHEAKHSVTQINFREMSPNNTDVSLRATRDEVNQGSSIAVPGFIKGMQKAHGMLGKVQWKALFDQASKLASDGVSVTEEFADAISTLDMGTISADLKNLVTKEDNATHLKVNDTLKQPDLANTLKAIGENPGSFYTGSLAQSLVEAVGALGSSITRSDMKDYEAESDRDVLKVQYKDMTIVASGVPSSGPVVLSTLNYLSKYSSGNDNSTSNLMYHRMLEALKFSYGYQTKWEYCSQVNASLMGKTALSAIKDNGTYGLSEYMNGSQPLQLNTGAEQHVTVIGHDRLIVTVVFGIGSPFGSKAMTSGYLLNNAMLDFSWAGKNNNYSELLQPSQVNLLSGRKRPLSGMSTSLVMPSETKCGLYVGFDAHSNTKAISALVQTIIRKAGDMNLDESIRTGRLSQSMVPFEAAAENTVPSELITYLRDLGHNINTTKTPLGICSAMSYLEGDIRFYGDERDEEDSGIIF